MGTAASSIATGYKGITGSVARTCTAWINTHGSSTDIMYWGSATDSGGKWRIRTQMMNGIRVLRAQVQQGSASGSFPISDDEWTHIAVVVPEGASSTDDIRMYINGFPEAQEDLTVVSHAINTSVDSDVLIGSNGVEFAQGLIDDVRIYDRELTPEDRERLISLYDGNLLRVDDQLQKMVESWRARRPGRALRILITSDHGEAFAEHGRYGHSFTVFEEMTHIPAVFWPREAFVSLQAQADDIHSNADLLPLLLGWSLHSRRFVTIRSLRAIATLEGVAGA